MQIGILDSIPAEVLQIVITNHRPESELIFRWFLPPAIKLPPAFEFSQLKPQTLWSRNKNILVVFF
jgi:hypothetical protein